jgi:predicted MFS family arabinose efflux permease
VTRTSERTLLLLVGAVQLVNVLDFMMVMPLGPDFAAGLGIDPSKLGFVGGAYTAAAALAGIAGASFLDRFDRRHALAGAMLGLVLGTAAGGFAQGLGTMVLARAVAGAFGGPATALSIAIVADVVPPERRGKALGKVMGAFSVASVLGVPAGLELARHGGWRTPFFAVAGLGLVVAGGAVALMPSLRGHLDRPAGGAGAGPLAFLQRPGAALALAATACSMASTFAIVPNIAQWVQFNLGYPRERLGLLYMIGGTMAFFSLRLAGRAIDRFGGPVVAGAGTAIVMAAMVVGFGWPPAGLPVLLLLAVFMVGNSTRNVSVSSLATRVPGPAERARFLSAQSAVQHLASAAGAAGSTLLLTVLPDGRLAGMRTLVILCLALSAPLPFLLGGVSKRVQRAASTGQGKDALLSVGVDTQGGEA